MKKNLCNTKKGMTLIELIIAMALIGIIAVVFISIYTTTIYWAVRSGDRTKNISTAGSIVENALEGATIKNSSTEINAIDIEGPGGEIITIPNADYTEENAVVLEVLFKGSSVNKSVLSNVRKVRIKTDKDSVKSTSLETQIEVYQP